MESTTQPHGIYLVRNASIIADILFVITSILLENDHVNHIISCHVTYLTQQQPSTSKQKTPQPPGPDLLQTETAAMIIW